MEVERERWRGVTRTESDGAEVVIVVVVVVMTVVVAAVVVVVVVVVQAGRKGDGDDRESASVTGRRERETARSG